MKINNSQLIVEMNPVSIKFFEKDRVYANLIEFDITQENNFILLVQSVSVVDDVLQLFVTDLNNDIRLTIKQPTEKLLKLIPNTIIYSVNTFAYQIPVRKLTFL